MEIFPKNLHEAIHHNRQIPIFDVPYKYTWVLYGLITYLMKFQSSP
jgi:hypothetical protein